MEMPAFLECQQHQLRLQRDRLINELLGLLRDLNLALDALNDEDDGRVNSLGEVRDTGSRVDVYCGQYMQTREMISMIQSRDEERDRVI